METLKQSLSKKKLSENNRENTETKQVFITENSGFRKLNGRTCNPSKVISVAWRKAERLDDQIRKIMQVI